MTKHRTVEEIRRRGRASRHYYWRCWALRQGATDSEALHVAEALERQLQTGRAPGMADQVRVLNWLSSWSKCVSW